VEGDLLPGSRSGGLGATGSSSADPRSSGGARGVTASTAADAQLHGGAGVTADAHASSSSSSGSDGLGSEEDLDQPKLEGRAACIAEATSMPPPVHGWVKKAGVLPMRHLDGPQTAARHQTYFRWRDSGNLTLLTQEALVNGQPGVCCCCAQQPCDRGRFFREGAFYVFLFASWELSALFCLPPRCHALWQARGLWQACWVSAGCRRSFNSVAVSFNMRRNAAGLLPAAATPHVYPPTHPCTLALPPRPQLAWPARRRCSRTAASWSIMRTARCTSRPPRPAAPACSRCWAPAAAAAATRPPASSRSRCVLCGWVGCAGGGGGGGEWVGGG
jgi:hypothetical protein